MATAAAALGALSAGISAGKDALDLATGVIEFFNKATGGASEIWEKVRALQITIVNLDTERKLTMNDHWFDSGKFWNQPFWSIEPGQSQTFFVCDKDGSILTGVSGGVGFNMYAGDESKPLPDWFVCTFSSPYAGSIKGKCAIKGKGIEPLWKQMDDADPIREETYGFYKGVLPGIKDTTNADKKLVFILKTPDVKW